MVLVCWPGPRTSGTPDTPFGSAFGSATFSNASWSEEMAAAFSCLAVTPDCNLTTAIMWSSTPLFLKSIWVQPDLGEPLSLYTYSPAVTERVLDPVAPASGAETAA